MTEQEIKNAAFDRSQINAVVLAKSVNADTGAEITTLQLKIPTMILAELNTHRVFSRNASSARAVPFKTILKRVTTDPFVPDVWTSNQPGMVGKIITDKGQIEELRTAWIRAMNSAVDHAQSLVNKHDVHKQVANRLLAPFMWTNVVLTSTMFNGFYAQRISDQAEPHMNILAKKMKAASDAKEADVLYGDEWHLPYVIECDYATLDIETLKKISVARCARVSYRNFTGTDSIEADIDLYNRLLSMYHMSPFEHIAQKTGDKMVRSGNFVGWIQLRDKIEGGDEENGN